MQTDPVRLSKKRWDFIFGVGIVAALLVNLLLWLVFDTARGFASIPLFGVMWWYFRRSTHTNGNYRDADLLAAEHRMAVKGWFHVAFFIVVLLPALLAKEPGWIEVAILLAGAAWLVRELHLYERERNAILEQQNTDARDTSGET